MHKARLSSEPASNTFAGSPCHWRPSPPSRKPSRARRVGKGARQLHCELPNICPVLNSAGFKISTTVRGRWEEILRRRLNGFGVWIIISLLECSRAPCISSCEEFRDALTLLAMVTEDLRAAWGAQKKTLDLENGRPGSLVEMNCCPQSDSSDTPHEIEMVGVSAGTLDCDFAVHSHLHLSIILLEQKS